MSNKPPADNATRPCTRCGRPRSTTRRRCLCLPCWNKYLTERKAARKERRRSHALAVSRRPAQRVPRDLKVGSTAGVDAPGLGTADGW